MTTVKLFAWHHNPKSFPDRLLDSEGEGLSLTGGRYDLFDNWLSTDPSGLTEWLQHRPAEWQRSILLQFGDRIPPAQAIALLGPFQAALAETRGGEKKRTPTLLERKFSKMLSSVLKSDPRGAVDLVLGQLDSNLDVYLPLALDEVRRSSNPQSITTLLDQLLSSSEPMLRSEDMVGSLAALAQVGTPGDAERLWRWASDVNLSGKERKELLATWAAKDPGGLLDHWAGSDQPLTALPPEALSSLARMMLLKPDHDASAWVQQLPVETQSYVFATMIRDPHLSLEQSADLLQTALEQGFEDLGPLQATIDYTIEAMQASNPDEAFQWVDSLPAGDARQVAFRSLAKQWAESDPVATAHWLDSQASGNLKDIGIRELALQIPNDIDTALSWADSISDPTLRAETLHQISAGASR